METPNQDRHNRNALQVLLGDAVRSCRNQLGLSQEELAWRAGLHRTYIADVERGSRNISLRNIANLASALDVSVSSLLSSVSKQGPGVMRARGRQLGEILMIEDNKEDAELALRAFRRANFSNPVKVITDGEAALNFLMGRGRRGRKKAKPQLILLDLNLPKISGVELLRAIRSEPRTKEIPVVVLTASQSDTDIHECISLGAASYLVKPVGFENFLKVTSQLSFKWGLLKPEPESPNTSKRAA